MMNRISFWSMHRSPYLLRDEFPMRRRGEGIIIFIVKLSAFSRPVNVTLLIISSFVPG